MRSFNKLTVCRVTRDPWLPAKGRRQWEQERVGEMCWFTSTNRSCLRKKREGRKRRDNGRQEWERDGDDSCEIGGKKKTPSGQSEVRWSGEQTRKTETRMNMQRRGGGGGKRGRMKIEKEDAYSESKTFPPSHWGDVHSNVDTATKVLSSRFISGSICFRQTTWAPRRSTQREAVSTLMVPRRK